MLKRVIAILLIAVLLVTALCACGKVTLHCDGCGKAVKCDKDMDEDWIIYCKACEDEFFGGPIVEAE